MNDNLARVEYQRNELLNGRLVMMSPRPTYNHNRIAFNIAYMFEKYLVGKSCTVIADGTDLYLTEKDRFVPDMMIVCDRNKIKYNGVHGAPDLLVEVLSPGTYKNDRGYKKDLYSKCGVHEYWLVEPASFTLEQYLLENGQLEIAEIYHLYPDYMLADMDEKELAEVVTEFKCSLYDDLLIKLEDIFANLI